MQWDVRQLPPVCAQQQQQQRTAKAAAKEARARSVVR
jgi:hypothetical protein